MPRIVWFFILIAALFAVTHIFATATALYWYYSWFDILMHLWGGMLLVLGVHALSTLRFVPLVPNVLTIIVIAAATMISWEVFERSVGLFNPDTYLFDTTKDFLVGTLGVIIGYIILKHRSLSL